METPTSTAQALIESAEAYGKTSIELAKLKSLDAAARIVTSLVSRGSVVVMVAFFALFFNVGLALMIGEFLGHIYFGFFIVAGFYLLVGLIFHFFMDKWIRKPIAELIITEALQ
jgi:hypothetical protein